MMKFLNFKKRNLNTSLKDKLFSKKSPFPIFSEEGNKVTTIDGEVTYSYELTPEDLEQYPKESVLDVFQSLQAYLNSIDENSWIKFYRWEGEKVYVSSNISDLRIPNTKVDELNTPSAHFFSEADPFSDINFFENYLTVNTEYWRLINLQEPTSDSFESYLDQFDHDYCVMIKKIGLERAKKELRQKRRSQGVTLNSLHQNHEGEDSYHEANTLLREVSTQGEGIFSTSVWFVVKSETFERLNDKTVDLIKAIREKGGEAFVETDGLDYFFNHLVFGVPPSRLKSFSMKAKSLANLVPYSNDRLHKKGLELYSRSGNPIFLNLFDEASSNQNWLITGTSGEGKSFLGATLIYELFNQGVNIGIFDLGKSLKRIALYLGAVDLSQKFNPMQFRCPYFLKKIIIASVGKNEFSRKEEGKLFELIERALEERVTSFKNLIISISEEMSGIEHYFSELWEYFGEDFIDLPKIFYLDTEGMPEGLIAPYLVFAKELSEAHEGRGFNIFDESWDVFDKCPEIIKTRAKTARKKLIGNIFLTQEIVELSEGYGDVAKAVIGNTYGKIYFNQPDLNHPILSNFEKERISLVKSSKGNYSEFFISTPDNKKIARLLVSPLLYELCNSEKEHVTKQSKFIEDHKGVLNYKDAIDKWVRAVYE
jgi:hypothetical protein